MKAVDLMMEEHRLIERMLRVLEDSAGILDRGRTVPPGMLAGLLEFIQVYADAGHHAKEEEIFFPALAAHGVTAEASAIGAFLAQHESGRLLVREMLGALAGVNRGEKAACQAFSASAVEYVALLRQHIRLEDQHFAEYAEEYLSPEEDAALRERMDAVDRDRASDAGTDRFHQMVAEYEKVLLVD